MKFFVFIVFVLGMALGGAGIYFWNERKEPPQAPAPQNQGARPVRAASALGRIQPAGGILTLGTSLPDRLGKLFVDEGKTVEEGEVLAELESRLDRELDVKMLDLQIREAEEKIKEIKQTASLQLALDRLQVKQVEELGPLDVSMQKLKVEFLKKQADQAREGLKRLTSLVSVSKQEKDQQEMVALQTQAELAGAEEQLQKMTLAQDLNLNLAKAKLDLAKVSFERSLREVPVESLKHQRELALRRLSYTQLKAPGKGKILWIMARPGELVGAPKPILQMADLSQMAVMAEVYETDIHKVFEGQQVDITSKAENARKMTGKVVAIGNMIGKNDVVDRDPVAIVDRRVIDVKILLDQPAQAAGLINHQVNVTFQPK